MSPSAWSLGVLAGGRSTRMGADKASRPFRGLTLLDHAIARFAPAGTPVLVSTRSASAPVPAGAIPAPDREPGLGPLAGIASLLAASPTPFILIVPVDLPLFPAGCGAALSALHQHAGTDAVVLSWAGRVEPFPVFLSRGLSPVLDGLLRSGLRRADAFHDRCARHVADFADAFPGHDPATAFLNVNTPEDLLRAEALTASEGR